ncbi:hypothetical protein [Poritiphilus flavus]|uniref:Uncharacterized protein n=1 Tax=Poritiphilus flavus TaxID=2697053 RepID=A0A6L9E9K8_9FLAO|nr:hypothetical protein [Poritiphilus flavus]NAS11324.1 hypothetical protein [Poritiphilus flavus]
MNQPKRNSATTQGLLISSFGMLATMAGLVILSMDGHKSIYLSLCIIGAVLATIGLIVIAKGFGKKEG